MTSILLSLALLSVSAEPKAVIDGGTGWAFVWTRKAAMAVAGGGGIVLLVAAAVAALVIAIKGRADDAFGGVE